MKTFFATVLFLSFSSSGAVWASGPPEINAVDDPLQGPVLACHSEYAHRYARNTRDASATEIATTSMAHCKPQMDAYVREARASEDLESLNFSDRYQMYGVLQKQAQELKEFAFNYTVAEVIQARALLK